MSSPASGPSPTIATRSPRPDPTEQLGGLDQGRQALLRVEASDADHERLAGAGTEALADLGRGPDGHRRGADRTDHPDRTAGVLLHVAADLGRDRDQRVGPPEHGPLQHPHDVGCPTARLVEDQVVDGDDHGRSSAAPPPAHDRQPSGLEAVGVDDADPGAAGLRLPQPPGGAEQPARLEAGRDRHHDVDRPDAVEHALGTRHHHAATRRLRAAESAPTWRRIPPVDGPSTCSTVAVLSIAGSGTAHPEQDPPRTSRGHGEGQREEPDAHDTGDGEREERAGPAAGVEDVGDRHHRQRGRRPRRRARPRSPAPPRAPSTRAAIVR